MQQRDGDLPTQEQAESHKKKQPQDAALFWLGLLQFPGAAPGGCSQNNELGSHSKLSLREIFLWSTEGAWKY